MATFRAISTGNYSDLARWQVSTDGGVTWSAATVLPTVADGVFANGFNITVNVDSFASFYSRASSTGVAAGGTFFMTNNRIMVGDIASTPAAAVTLTVAGLNTPTFVIGNVGVTGGGNSRGIEVGSTTGAGILTVTGNVSGPTTSNADTAGILIINTVGVVIIGNVTNGAGGPAIKSLGGAGIFSVVGRAIGTNTLAGASSAICDEIQGVGTGCRVRHKIIIPLQGCAVPQIAAGFSPVIEFANEVGTVITYNNLNNQGQAATSNVRSGTVYANGALTGTCAVPPAASVAFNVPVDNTVGSLATAAVVAADLLTEMNNSNLPIAQGLRDGMGASAAAIAAVGSINVIP
jgi:hypothetical protein